MARLTFANIFWFFVRVISVLVICFLFGYVWRGLLWTPWMPDLLYDTANAIGIGGDEAVLDFYADVGFTLSVVAAIAIVVLAHRWWKRRAARHVGLPAR